MFEAGMRDGRGDGLTVAPGVARRLPGLTVFCIACLFFIPFLWPLHGMPIHSFVNEWLAAVLMLVAGLFAVFAVSRDRGARPHAFPFVGLLFAALAAVVLLQMALGIFTYSSDALFPLLGLLLATAAAATGTFCASQAGVERLTAWISIAVIAGGLLNVLVQFNQLLSNSGVALPLFRYYTGGGLYGLVGQQNHLATYLGWGIAACLYLHARGTIRSWLAILLLVLLLTGDSLTTSRMSWLQVGCIAAAGALFALRASPDARAGQWRMLLMLPILYLATCLLLPVVLELAQLNFGGSSLKRLASGDVGGLRPYLLRQAWEIFLAHPLLGVGAGGFTFQQFLLADRMPVPEMASSSHNLLFDLLAMTGLSGTLVFLAILLPALRRLLKSANTPEAVCLTLMLAVFGIHALLEYPEWYLYFLLPVAFMFGALETKFIKVGRNLLVRTLPAVAMLYGLGLSGVAMVQYAHLQELYIRHYLKNQLVGGVDSAAVGRIEDYSSNTLFAGPAEFLLCFNFYLNEIALERKLEISSRAMRYLAEPNIVYRHVVLLALAGRQEEGVAHLMRLKNVNAAGFEDVAAEMRRLGQSQPAVFGKIGDALNQLQSVRP